MPQSPSFPPHDPAVAVAEAFAHYPQLPGLCGDIRQVLAQDGLTNRVLRIEATRGSFILRLPRPETAGLIDRHAEANNQTLAADLGIAVPALFCDADAGVLLTAAMDIAVPAGPELCAALGRLLARLHHSAVIFSGRLDPARVIARHEAEIAERPDLAALFAPLKQALAGRGALRNGPKDLCPCHGDLSPGNLLGSAAGLVLIDWEYSAQADPVWDLAYAILENGFSNDDQAAFLTAYASRSEEQAALLIRIERMKSVCDAVSALWALGQVAADRDTADFRAFAQARITRALVRLGG